MSPVCVGKNRPLTPHEATKEHLIPKSILKNPKFKTKLAITFNPSQLPNIDISCHKCNNLKNDLADVPFVWKLQYCKRHGISLVNKTKLAKTVEWGDYLRGERRLKDRILICIYKGNIKHVSKEECHLVFPKIEVKLKRALISEVIDHQNKLPRKKKKQSKVI